MKLAAVFPGQGSQSPGMLADLAAQYKVVEETFAEASEELGYDLWDMAQNGTAEQQRQTEITQPLMFAGGISVWRIWQELNMPAPSFVAGHSLGELCADRIRCDRFCQCNKTCSAARQADGFSCRTRCWWYGSAVGYGR